MSLPADLHLRPLEPGDGEALIALVRACDETYLEWAPAGWSVPVTPPTWPEGFRGPGRWAQVAVDADGRLVASVAFRQAHVETAPGPPDGPLLDGVAHVAIVFVHPSRWRQGIAATLLGEAELEMVRRGFVRARLWTPEGSPAERFYAAHGWEQDGRRAWHPWVGLTVVGYAKELA